ncbi:SDR family NAD(P)-dependent oxidoreductase [Streptomyces sp. SID8381]|uniref:SDR family NAD(P)-dependent oxidoreductase n=1 Tax=unclassified Streptomyces TaxID=2593676 RepID=UPI000363F2DE|nr:MULTISPECIES: SDR family NAD(P)-dependent oxidoreductase [unclassified Streptomyces]MYX27085.1 SDR family NAD(P)-dependent oxidoreductase [Streptomyces sp. SID8381]
MPPKTALVTGVGREAGLGFAVARELAAQGFHAVLTARRLDAVEPLAALLREEGGQATALRLDLADSDSLRETAGQLADAFGRLDVLVNNASAMPDFRVLNALDADMDDVRTALEVSVLGPWALTQALLPLLKAAPAARIVNVSSRSAQQIATGLDLGAPLRSPAYSMAKYMLNALTGVLARALADTPILVNAVDPGNTATHPERGDAEHDRPAADSARDIVRAATLGPDGPTGRLFSDGRTTT